MADLPDLSELFAKADKSRLDFLRTDLALCFTFSDLVITELRMGESEAAKRVLAKAEQGYDSISWLLRRVDDGPDKEAIGRGLGDLRVKLNLLHQRVNMESGNPGEGSA